MKQTILLASASQANLIPLLESTEGVLAPINQKYCKVFFIEQLEKAHVSSGAQASKKVSESLDSQVEYEMGVEEYTKSHGIEVETLKKVETETLISESSVADLMVIDLQSAQHKSAPDWLNYLIEFSACPLLLLPGNVDVECLVAAHDASQETVKMMKGFLKLFNEDLRNLPLSLLMSDPESELEMEREKVFIKYLKVYFQNIGAQHLYDEAFPSLFRYVQNECDKPMLIVNTDLGQQILESTEQFETQILEHPIFIFKD